MKTYLITGVTGYIGSMITRYLLSKDLDDQDSIRIIAIVRDMDRARSLFSDHIFYVQADITDFTTISSIYGDFDYIIHCASTTKSAQMISNPVETVSGIVSGTQNILELAKRCNVKSMIYLSSMEIYGNIDCSAGHKVTEDELGELDIFNTRSCYPLAKRMAEHYCYVYYKEYAVPVKIARLSQTFGAGILAGETRVFAQFADAALNKKDIVLHTAGDSVGNYCDIQEVIDAIMLLIREGKNGEAYNVVNEDNTMTIREMAKLVAGRVAKGDICVTYDIPKENSYGYAADTGIRLSGSKLQAIGWKAKKGLEEMFDDLIKYLDEI
jgi:nucleoside-diphosphate-sugar epimerase